MIPTKEVRPGRGRIAALNYILQGQLCRGILGQVQHIVEHRSIHPLYLQ